MPLFRCFTCNTVENTALSNYWMATVESTDALCSACDPLIGAWHDRFPRRSADGLLVGRDGFLYYEDDFRSKSVHHTTPRGRIVDGREVALDADTIRDLTRASGRLPGRRVK